VKIEELQRSLGGYGTQHSRERWRISRPAFQQDRKSADVCGRFHWIGLDRKGCWREMPAVRRTQAARRGLRSTIVASLAAKTARQAIVVPITSGYLPANPVSIVCLIRMPAKAQINTNP
jgi:hypothetical protein